MSNRSPLPRPALVGLVLLAGLVVTTLLLRAPRVAPAEGDAAPARAGSTTEVDAAASSAASAPPAPDLEGADTALSATDGAGQRRGHALESRLRSLVAEAESAGASAQSQPGGAPRADANYRALPGAAPFVGPMPDREGYADVEPHDVHRASEQSVSTFSIDVDTASYANVRRLLAEGRMPPPGAVRVEELINYFGYDYPSPEAGETFAVRTEVGPSPWHAQRRLLHIGIRGVEPDADALGPANLVFLVDVSGSMRDRRKLPLLQQSLRLLADQLEAEDSVAIVTYAGNAGVVLAPTPGDQRAAIRAAIDRLSAGGSTNGGAGIRLAYDLARQAFVDGGVNRVILATDGDFNVGTVDHDALERLVEREREGGVALTVLGFGAGNYQDGLMQRLAQIGNGNAAYIDTIGEARKVLVDELTANMAVIARDVKVQIEFNPAVVAEYRLIGYETRALAREDFANDRVDAGDVGAGHTVTALYELALVGGGGELMAPLRYQPPGPSQDAEQGRARGDGAPHRGELAFLRLRYKPQGADVSELREFPLALGDVVASLDATSADFRFSAAVAAYGQLLRDGRYLGEFSFDDTLALAQGARGPDPHGYRGEFLGLLRTAQALAGPARATAMQR